MRPNVPFHDVDELRIAKVLRYYEEPPAGEYRKAQAWDVLAYWALAILFTFCITLAAS